MKKYLYFITGLALFSTSINAMQLQKLNNTLITVNECKYTKTDSPLDLALINKGYFVVKRSPRSGLFYTRYGYFFLSANAYLINAAEEYVQGLDPNSPDNSLSNIQIPMEDIAPRPTDTLKETFNLPASSEINQNYIISHVIYDPVGALHTMKIDFSKLSSNTWKTSVAIDDLPVTTGQLIFDNAGQLISQSRLQEIHWTSPQGLQIITINNLNSTQYALPFKVSQVSDNGYPAASLQNVYFSADGEINLYYSNGQQKKLDLIIAVSFFDNPAGLNEVVEHLYSATENSGPGSIQTSNGYGAILNGYLESERCLPNG